MHLRKYLYFILIAITTAVSAQSTNFLKKFSITPAFTNTTQTFVLAMHHQGIAIMNSSSFILGGVYYRYSDVPGDTLLNDSYLIKNQTDGLTKWFRKYHMGNRVLVFTDVSVNHNNEIIAVGYVKGDISQPKNDGIVFHADSNGHFKSLRIYQGQPISIMKILKDKKIALLASDSNTKFLKLVLLDKDCNLIWSKALQHNDTNCCEYSGNRIVEGKDKSILIVGTKSSSVTIKPFALLCDSNGNKINDFTAPLHWSRFYSASNNFGDGFFIVGTGDNYSSTQNLFGHLLRVNNQLQLMWYKFYQCNYGNVEFTDIINYSRNNFSLLTEPEGAGILNRRAGFTFFDSTGFIRRSYLFNPLNTDHYPDKMLPLENGKVLFTFYSSLRLFGVTDTLGSGFCNSEQMTWSNSASILSPTYNQITFVNKPFTYRKDTLYVYTPKDLELLYVCSNGPTGPLDTLNYTPTPSTLTTREYSDEILEEEKSFMLYPNPAKNYLTINTIKFPKTPVTFEIINSEGKSLLMKSLIYHQFPHKINVQEYPSGIYLLCIRGSKGILFKEKFIVTKEE